MPIFIHLRTHSAYSLCQGAIKIEDMACLAEKFKMPALALTDTDNLFGAMEFCLKCASHNIQPIIGCTVHMYEHYPLIVLAQTETGYQNLSQLMSSAYLKTEQYKTISWNELQLYNQDLIILAGYEKGLIGQQILHRGNPEEVIKKFADIFQDRFYMDISRHNTPNQQQIEYNYIELAYKHNVPLVATNEVYFPERHFYIAHDALCCIAEGRYVTDEDREKLTPEYYFKSAEEMKALFHDLPEAIENTVNIAQRCAFMLTVQKPKLPPYPMLENYSERDFLIKRAKEGLNQRLIDEKIEERAVYDQRLEYELGVIEQMGFPGYFLIVSDFVQWAIDQKIPVGPGRGSGAGSLVAWSLRITNMNPIKYGLVFERFLNPERVSLPDFDIDFCPDRRDEVINYVREKYGTERVAHIITFGTLQAKGVLRDVGRVLLMPYAVPDRLSRMIPAGVMTLQSALELSADLKYQYDNDEAVKQLVDISLQLEGLYRHASTHAAGVVIAGSDLVRTVPLYREPDSTILSTQFSMKYVELSGLLKFDFLGLKTLTIIKDCAEMINLDIEKIPLDDAKTFKMIGQGYMMGIFQFESPFIKDVIMKLQPDCFEDLIALNALNRPGPMDDIPRYIERKLGREKVTYLHPMLEPILKPTYGVMVYQEQVLEIARTLGGYTMGSADLLRRAMGKKIKSEMDQQRAFFIEGAKKNNISPAVANHIFDQMAKFSGYGFNKSHSAPYALIAYQTAYLKANYPKEFFASIMTHESQDHDKLNLYYEEMRQIGIPLYLPCVNQSHARFRVDRDGVRYGLLAIKNVGHDVAKSIEELSPFKDLKTFFKQINPRGMNKRQAEFLCQAGAFDTLEGNRKRIFETLDILSKLVEEKTSQISLFSDDTLSIKLPEIEDFAYEERLQLEKNAIGIYLTGHPIKPYEVFFPEVEGKQFKLGIVEDFQERIAKTSKKKYAYLRLSDTAGAYEVLLFSEQLEKFGALCVVGSLLYLEYGTAENGRMIVYLIDTIENKIQNTPLHLTLDFANPQPLLHKLLSLSLGGKQKIHIHGDFSEIYSFEIILKNVQMDAKTKSELLGRWG